YEWLNGEPVYMKKALSWYTYGPKTLKGNRSCGWEVRPRTSFSFRLGKLATVFYAEVTALAECARISVKEATKAKQSTLTRKQCCSAGLGHPRSYFKDSLRMP
ncbi:hypothetical protein J6590_100461, partial [Homalodisca vitripennis]